MSHFKGVQLNVSFSIITWKYISIWHIPKQFTFTHVIGYCDTVSKDIMHKFYVLCSQMSIHFV